MLVKTLILVSTAIVCMAGQPKIVRPCALYDHKCIRDNLKANSRCNPRVQGAIPNEYTFNYFKFEAPYFNATYIESNITVKNHDKCVFSEFFFNRATDVAVIAIDCPNYYLEADRKLIQHNPLQEDTTYSFHIKSTYPLVRLTMNIPHANRMDICSTPAYAYVTTLPIFHINPNDKPTENFLTRDLSYMYIYERESFNPRAASIMRYTINSLICNFGCDF